MNDFFVSAMLLGALSSGDGRPFWATANQNGLMPQYGISLAMVNAKGGNFAGSRVGMAREDASRAFRWQSGVSLAAALEAKDGSLKVLPVLDELYGGIRWKQLGLDAGMMHREREFLGSCEALGSLSVSEGHVVESNNARSMPGYRLVLEPLAIPWTGGRLSISGVWGDYATLDNRFMDGALVHRLRGYLRYDITSNLFVQLGLDHYAVWGGSNKEMGSMPVSFKNYLRIATGRGGTAENSLMDRQNTLGDHGGAEQLRLGWKNPGKGYGIVFQWEKPYADKSGMRMDNFPDGIYTLHFSFDDKDRWVSDILLEAHYTMWQSGTIQEKLEDEEGNLLPPEERAKLKVNGGDNYFNNDAYRSGWTHFGRGICAPLFYAGINPRFGERAIRSNRYKALHLGIGGKLLRKAPYRLMLTAGEHYGTYAYPYVGESSWMSGLHWWELGKKDEGLFQFSGAFSGLVPIKGGFAVNYGLYADFGKVLSHNLGLSLGCSMNF